jgi:hypothetical protein
MRPRAGLFLLTILVFTTAACGDVKPVAPDAGPAPVTSPPGAVVLSAGGTVESASYRLDVQIGEAMLPRPVRAGDTTVAPHGAIQP